MNKYAALVLLALTAVALSSPLPEGNIEDIESVSESALNPTDSEETAGLSGKDQIFSDFCIQTRDLVIGDIKQTSNDAASKGFGVVFESAESLGKEVLGVQKLAASRLSNQIANPDAAIEEPTNEIEEIIATGQKKVQEEQTQPRSLYQAFVATVQATGSAIGAQVSQRLNQIKNLVGVDQVVAILDGGCTKVSEYEQRIREQFEETKNKIVEHDPSLASVTVEQVPCLTTRRIIRMEGICGLARAAQMPVKKIINRQ